MAGNDTAKAVTSHKMISKHYIESLIGVYYGCQLMSLFMVAMFVHVIR